MHKVRKNYIFNNDNNQVPFKMKFNKISAQFLKVCFP